MLLTANFVRLGAAPTDKTAAICQAAAILVENGAVSAEYIQGMLNREAQENTYLGNGVAIPHGTPESREYIHKTAVAVLQIPQGIDWEDGERAHLIVAIAASDAEHLTVLKKLSHVVGDEDVAAQLAQTTQVDDIVRALSALNDEETAESAPESAAKGLIVGVTACPTGVAHTYMAQEALEKAAAALHYHCKIETQGSVGVDHALTAEEIERADVVIIAADTNVDLDRFAGKKIYKTSTKAAINDAAAVIAQSFQAGTFAAGEQKIAAKSEQNGIYKHLMTGVSYMLPFVVAGGLLIALGFAIGSFMFGAQGIYIYQEQFAGTLGQTLFQIGKDAFALFIPILGGYIAYSIAGRAGIAPAMVGAYIAANTGAGFLGAIIAGFIAGYFVSFLAKLIKLPQTLESLKPMLILPLIGTAVTGLLMYYLIAQPMAQVQHYMETWLTSMNETSAFVLGATLGGMMALDMGGPINKAAYLFSTALIASEVFAPMAATMAAGMTPPMAIFLATIFFKNRFTDEERQAGKATGILGLSFITEGAIPFAAKDPLRVIPALVMGSAVAGGLSMAFGCGLRAPHGGVFVLFIPNAVIHLGLYALAIILGTLVSTVLLGVLKPKLSH